MEVLAHRDLYKLYADDPQKAEYFVKMDWLDKVPTAQAINEVGLFGNQNTVCQPTAQKWRYTVDKLKTRFPNRDAEGRRLTSKYLAMGTGTAVTTSTRAS